MIGAEDARSSAQMTALRALFRAISTRARSAVFTASESEKLANGRK